MSEPPPRSPSPSPAASATARPSGGDGDQEEEAAGLFPASGSGLVHGGSGAAGAGAGAGAGGGGGLTVQDVAALLRTQFAVITGGRTRDGQPIVTFPGSGAQAVLSDQEFQRLALYLTSVPSMQEVDAGFVLVVDRRRDRWSSVKGVLLQVSAAFPGLVHVVYVLRPSGLLQKAISEVSSKLLPRDEFKFPVVVCGSLEELHAVLDRAELSADLGGDIAYNHDEWIAQRVALDKFSRTTRDVSASLDGFTRSVSEQPEPDTVEGLSAQLHAQGQQYLELKEGILDAARCGELLLRDIRRPGASPKERASLDSVTSVERLLVQLEETERTFDEFWQQHSARLKQLMELYAFERGLVELTGRLAQHAAAVQDAPHAAESVEGVDALAARLQALRERCTADVERAEDLIRTGQQLAQARHYVLQGLEQVRPSCEDLQERCTELARLLEDKEALLRQYRALQERLKHAADWCTGGVELLALHPVAALDGASCPRERADQLAEQLDAYLANGRDLMAAAPLDFHPLMHDAKVTTPETRAAVAHAVQRLAEVRAQVEKHLVTVKHLHPAPAPTAASPAPSPSPSPDLIIRGGRPKSLCEPDSKQGHVLTELVTTEQAYVSELGAIIRGYKHELENDKYQTMIPVQLQGKSNILFGNLEEIHAFHANVFLPELQNCVLQGGPAGAGAAAELVALCFTQCREQLFQLYSAYCQNIPRSEALRDAVPEAALFFQACQMKLGHKLPLAAYLLKPVQRITKYQLLLKDLANKGGGDTSEALEAALDCMLVVLKCVNDSMHQVAITGFWGDLAELGPLLLQGSFSVWSESKKDRLRELRLKPMQRHIFFYQKALVFCKKIVNNKATYHFKRYLKMSQVGLTESVKGDPKKFEVWLQGRQEVHTIQAATVEQTQQWVNEIKRVLLEQLRELKGEKIRQYSLVQQNSVPKPLLDASSAKRSLSCGESNGSRSTSASTCVSEEEDQSSEYSVSEDEDGFSEHTCEGGRYVSLADYSAIGRSEVSMAEGDVVELLKVGCAGWWFVKVQSSQREGWVPAAFLEHYGKKSCVK
ncbi:Guanine nucleotide exchange factor DBS [Frankliniella fusca]|uniref:Guanine nucleotide exchange factor DBS n=1 Tax=Frankliniella fusca TaxID=407009 RepID=A0AAE1LCD2_9NEOP|nr:Guanine nucleotide exchange factor DBS [Frankliniella fusca]